LDGKSSINRTYPIYKDFYKSSINGKSSIDDMELELIPS
jgi:hypothetical protein